VRSELHRVSSERMHLAAQLEAARLDGAVAGALARGPHNAPPGAIGPRGLPPSPVASVFSPVSAGAAPGVSLQGRRTSTSAAGSPALSTHAALSKGTHYGQSEAILNLGSAKPAGVFLTPVALPASKQHSSTEPWTAAAATPGTATASSATSAVIAAAARAASAAASAAATVASIRGQPGTDVTLPTLTPAGTPAR
jgi:hypothetical protein